MLPTLIASRNYNYCLFICKEMLTHWYIIKSPVHLVLGPIYTFSLSFISICALILFHVALIQLSIIDKFFVFVLYGNFSRWRWLKAIVRHIWLKYLSRYVVRYCQFLFCVIKSSSFAGQIWLYILDNPIN